MTSFHRFCERFIEAGWLVIAIVVVLFLDPFSDQVFEPDKVVLFRMLTVLMAAAWAIRALDGEDLRRIRFTIPFRFRMRGFGQWLREKPMAGPILLLSVTYLIATLFSVNPRVSWWGSYPRTQGTYTFLAYVALFLMVIAVLKRRGQLDRLIHILLTVSFPVSLYAILQHQGISLLAFAGVGDVETRVISTLGNAIFLAAYLSMVIPLTLYRIGQLWETRGTWNTASWGALAIYGSLLVLQLAAFVFTQSRGPGIGLAAGLLVYALVYAHVKQQRIWAWATVLAAGTGGLLLVAINFLGLWSDQLNQLPYLARFGQMLGAGADTVQARTLAWETTLKVLRAEPWRFLVGYGPETMKGMFTRYMPAQLWVLQGGGLYGTFDRAHNALFDVLFALGIVGAMAYLWFYAMLFYLALRQLGLVPTAQARRVLGGLFIAGGLVGLVVPWLWRGNPGLGAVGVPFGMLAGLVVYLLLRVLRPAPQTRKVTESQCRPDPLLMGALLAAVVGHFVESQTGIEIVSTQTYVWLYAAIIVLLSMNRIDGLEMLSEPAGERLQRRPNRRGRSRQKTRPATGWLGDDRAADVAVALLVAIILGVLSYAFMHGFNALGTRWSAQLLMIPTWLFGGLLFWIEGWRQPTGPSSVLERLVFFGMVSLFWLLPFSLLHRLNAQTLDRLPHAYLVFVFWLCGSVIGIAWALARARAGSAVRLPAAQGAVYLMIGLLAAIWVWQVDITRVRADIYEKIGKTALTAGLWDQALPNLERAVALQPHQAIYTIFLGNAYVEQARRAADAATQTMWMERAREVFERGYALAPYDSDQPRQLGMLYAVWAEMAPDEVLRRQNLQKSLAYYQEAVALNPENPNLRLDLAQVYFALGELEAAMEHYRHVLQIGSPHHLGRAYAGLGNVYLYQGQLDAALQAYQQAMQMGRDKQQVLETQRLLSNSRPADLQAREGLALAYAAAGRREEALKELQAVLEMAAAPAEKERVKQLMRLVSE